MLQVSGGKTAEVMGGDENTPGPAQGLGEGQQQLHGVAVQGALEGLPLGAADPLVQILGTAAARHRQFQPVSGVDAHDQVVLKRLLEVHIAAKSQAAAEVQDRDLRGPDLLGKASEGEKAALLRVIQDKVGDTLPGAAEGAVIGPDLLQNIHGGPFRVQRFGSPASVP